jgi:hypothetical protein
MNISSARRSRMFDTMARYHAGVDERKAMLRDWLKHSDAFAAEYRKFIQAGGLTGS